MAVVQYTYTHKQHRERHKTNNIWNNTKIHRTQKIHRKNTTTRKSAGRAPSLRVLPWHLPYNWGKSTEKPQSPLLAVMQKKRHWFLQAHFKNVELLARQIASEKCLALIETSCKCGWGPCPVYCMRSREELRNSTRHWQRITQWQIKHLIDGGENLRKF